MDDLNNHDFHEAAVPESYRPLIFILFGVWGWIVVSFVLHWQHIDVNLLLHKTTSYSNEAKRLFYFATTLSLLVIIHILLLEHTLFTQHTNFFNHIGPVILCYGLASALALFGPCKKESNKFLRSLYRLFFKLPGQQVYFADVLLADVLISFSGVFTGIFVKLMENTTLSYSRFVPFVTSIPYLIRLKQCFSDYFASQKRNKRQLVNAMKYMSAIPVIFLAHRTRHDKDIIGRWNPQEVLIWRLWFLSALVSNMFAFGWDLIMDWRLVQVELDNALMIRLRKDIHFSDPVYYIMAVGLNGLLRLLKVGSHLYHVHPFCVDLSEILRRWTWVIFRFENEWTKRSYQDIERAASIDTTLAVNSLQLQNNYHKQGITHLVEEEEKQKMITTHIS